MNENCLISSVTKDSPAEKAGLKANDVIKAVDGTAMKNSSNVTEAITSSGGNKVVFKMCIRDRLSGEALAKKEGGYNDELIENIANQVKTIVDKGTDVGVVIGGGNYWSCLLYTSRCV